MKYIKAVKWNLSIMITVLGLSSLNTHGQNKVLNYPVTGEHSSTTSITLAPGFSTSGPFRAFITGELNVKLNSNPSPTQNYIRSRTYTVPSTSELTDPSVSEVRESIAYFDGLGRPLQTVQTRASTAGNDIVQPIAYDAFGREAVKYLPYQETSGDGSYRSNAAAQQNQYYGVNSWDPNIVRTANPYGQTIFEASPLNRVLEQGAPGEAWQPATQRGTSGRTVVTSRGTNNLTTSADGYGVTLYKATPVSTAGLEYQRILSSSGLYGAGQLYLTILKDENWTSADGKVGTTEEYKDKEERIILKRTFNLNAGVTEVLSTYYVYDDLGNLSFVLPPAASQHGETISQAVLDTYCYQYRYDGRRRLIEKRIPGKKGWDEIIYNKLDQVVFTQDPQQRGTPDPGPYRSFIKYDGLGRIIMTGVEKGHAETRANVQNTVNNFADNWETRYNGEGHLHGYTNVSAAGYLPNLEIETVNYYDNYNIPNLPFNQIANYSNMTSGLLTASKVKVLGTSGTFLWTVNYYDDEGRLVRQYKQHYLDGAVSANNYDEIINTYNFVGELTGTTRKHFVNGAESLYAQNAYTYDHVGRPLDVKQRTGDNSGTGNPWVILSRNSYNQIGQLTSKGLHIREGELSAAQTIKYRHNPRGWLVSQSAPLFAQELKYDQDSTGVVPQYNGNISSQKWGVSNSLNKQYFYTYDRLNRLTGSVSTDRNDEHIGYDLMGNITSMQRYSANTLVDQMTYNYGEYNHLSSVGDANGNTNASFQLPGTTTYTYNDNGSMTSRINTTSAGNNMSSMTYNHLNLPASLDANGAMVRYTYDADGVKLKKVVSGGADVNNEYISGIEYDHGVLKSLTTPVGRVVKNGANNYSYEYVLSDHLGNGRVYFDIYAGSARKIQETDYYGFGLSIQRSVTGTENKYQYNGKEKQDQEKMYDYGLRYYDPLIARWNVVDPMAEGRNWLSPYNYVQNNPMLRIDPDGGFDWVMGADRQPYWDDAVTSANDSDLNGNIYLGKSATYTSTTGYTVELHADKTWNYYGGPPLAQNIPGPSLAEAVRANMPMLNLAEGIATGVAIIASGEVGGGEAAGNFLMGQAARKSEFLGGLAENVATRGRELFNFSSKAAEHMTNPGRAVPVQILEQAIKGSKGVADPRGSSALKYTTEMWKNGKAYTLDVLHNEATNSIWHFQYYIPK